MPVGIVALSFAKRAKEPNPVNVKLARITRHIGDDLLQRRKSSVVVAQWEIAAGMKEYVGAATQPTLIVTQQDATNKDRNGKPYLDSQDVVNKAAELFHERGITDVIVVANRFLHLQAARKLVKQAGFNVLTKDFKVSRVGFDNSPLNLQWWCKGPVRFMAYLGIQVIGKMTGQNFHGIWEKPHPH